MSDGRFYWLKVKRDFFKRHDIRIIEAMPNGKDYILFYLKLLCESVDHEGNLRFSEQIPYNEEMLATITNTNVDIVRTAIKIFTDLNMMEIMDDGTYFMSEVEKMIGSAVDNDNANRQRRFREKQKSLELPEDVTKNNAFVTESNASVTENNASVTKNNADITDFVTNNNESKSKSKSKSIEKEIEIDKERNNTKRERSLVEILDDVPIIQRNEYLKESLLGFIEMRKKIKSPLTERALKMAVNEAYKLAYGDPVRMKVLIDQSTMNGWKGIYPLKRNEQTSETDNPFTDILKEEGYV